MKVLPHLTPLFTPLLTPLLTPFVTPILESWLLRAGRLRPAPHLPLSTALYRSATLELAVLAGHLLLYPSGLTQERRTAPAGTTPGTGTAGTAGIVGKTGRPVVLLHGFIDNRSVFVLLRRALAKDRRRHVESLNYSLLTCDIRTAAELLARHVEEVCLRTGQRQVDIVGHSLGGLIARYYVQRLGGDTRVRTLVTLGTPHGGTAVAPLLSAHPIVRQMRPGSDVVAELEQPAPGCRTRFVAFWSDLDQVMSPVETARVDHPDLLAHNVRVSGIGHLALPVHPAVAADIRRALDADADTTRTDSADSTDTEDATDTTGSPISVA
ncbi:alpha/beta fold hydrolase [Streptomyces triticagri]|uniref:Alpha/beta fold hydrolase n=1 Tax=Streptomyces triticagri TaxID=2293568 RepID=A0A372M709_9ACTN|nr:alpha/beta fold hydrolase [Streptomyces triticagri]RFU86305.1 alpha/beta fold hydrolase [Streptomyces triticagri]